MPSANIICKSYKFDNLEPATDDQMSKVLGNYEDMTAREQTALINEGINHLGWTFGYLGQAEYLREDGKGRLIKTTIRQTVAWIIINDIDFTDILAE